MTELASARTLFVQPHFDDVALSCGGTVARAAADGDAPHVITVFSGGPSGGELTQFAKDLHERWAIGDMPWRVRGDEDVRALAVLGAGSTRLDYGEAIYRGHDTWPSVFGPVHERDRPAVDAIAHDLIERWRATPKARVYLPLGVGGHIDHSVCFLAGAPLREAGAEVWFYEDFPYATIAGRLERRLALIAAPFTVELVDVVAWIPQRVAAITCYASQLGLFDPAGPYPGPFEALVRRHASWLAGNDGACECFFRAA